MRHLYKGRVLERDWFVRIVVCNGNWRVTSTSGSIPSLALIHNKAHDPVLARSTNQLDHMFEEFWGDEFAEDEYGEYESNASHTLIGQYLKRTLPKVLQ